MSAITDWARGSRVRRGQAKVQGRRQGKLQAGEAIAMQKRRFGYFPQVFVWRGQRYYVEAVSRCWSESARSRGRRVNWHCFEVHCREGVFHIYQDAQINAWHMQRTVS